MKQKLAAMSVAERREKSALIAARFLSSSEYAAARTVFFYYSTAEEVDTSKLIHQALLDGKRVLLPRVIIDQMELVPFQAGDLMQKNVYGIEEPLGKTSDEPPDLAVIPLLAFDKARRRLGRGKGFYDRFLKGFSGKVVALAFGAQECDAVPTDPFDISPDVIVTEKERIQ